MYIGITLCSYMSKIQDELHVCIYFYFAYEFYDIAWLQGEQELNTLLL